jgi:hypothetical protein
MDSSIKIRGGQVEKTIKKKKFYQLNHVKVMLFFSIRCGKIPTDLWR